MASLKALAAKGNVAKRASSGAVEENAKRVKAEGDAAV
jgi:hypothetical protein